MYSKLGLGILIGLCLIIGFVLMRESRSQVLSHSHDKLAVRCWPVANGAAATMACDNGYWHTIMPDGTVITGNGYVDPNAGLPGSRIVIDPSTSLPTGNVIPPEPTVATPGPGQWYYGGYPPPAN